MTEHRRASQFTSLEAIMHQMQESNQTLPEYGTGKDNFCNPEVVKKYRREDEAIKSFIYKMNQGKQKKIWKQPTYFEK